MASTSKTMPKKRTANTTDDPDEDGCVVTTTVWPLLPPKDAPSAAALSASMLRGKTHSFKEPMTHPSSPYSDSITPPLVALDYSMCVFLFL